MYLHPKSHEERVRLMNPSQGKIPADVTLAGGQLVNVYSAEILPHLWVALKGLAGIQDQWRRGEGG
jgi:adenine deaminase